VIDKLLQHGIAVEELTSPLTAEVDVFTMRSVTRAPRAFQNHNEVKLTGEYKKESKTFPAGTIIVRTAQPLGILACYLLEAESDDGHASLAAILLCWHACYDSRPMTLNAVIQDVQTRAVETPSHVTPANEWNELRDALAPFDAKYDGKRLDGKRVGNEIRKMKGRVIDKKRLVQAGEIYKVALWKVESLK